MMNFFKLFTNDRRGGTALEYGLIVGVVALGLVTVLTNLTSSISAAFSTIGTRVQTAVSAFGS